MAERQGAFLTADWVRLLAVFAVLGGCAHVQVDADGTKHIVGLVSMEVPPAGSADANGGTFFRVTSLGLSILRTESETGVALGYHSYGSMMLRGDTCVGRLDLLQEQKK